MHVCLAVTCHLHFQQTDQDVFSHATAVTWERNRYQNKSQHRKLTREENYPTTFARTGTCDILITSPALYTRAIPVRLWLTWKTSVRVLLLLLCFLDLLFIFVSVMMTNTVTVTIYIFLISLYSFHTYWEFQPPAILWLYDGRKSPLSGAILQTFHGQHHFWKNWSSGNRAVAMMRNGHLPCFTWWHAWDSLADDLTGKKRRWNVWALTKSR